MIERKKEERIFSDQSKEIRKFTQFNFLILYLLLLKSGEKIGQKLQTDPIKIFSVSIMNC